MKNVSILLGALILCAAVPVVYLPNGYGPTESDLPNAATVIIDPNNPDAAGEINGAISAVARAGGWGVGTVYLPRGVYHLRDCIILKPGVRLVGAGAVGDDSAADSGQGTVLVFNPDAFIRHAITIARDTDAMAPPAHQHPRFTEIRNLKIVAEPSNTWWVGAIKLDGAHGTVIEDVTIEGFFRGTHDLMDDSMEPDGLRGTRFATMGATVRGAGITFDNGTFYSNVRRCRFTDCNAGLFFSNNSNANHVEDCSFDGDANSAIYSDLSSDNHIVACRVSADVTRASFDLDDHANWNIVGCTLDGPDEVDEFDLFIQRTDESGAFLSNNRRVLNSGDSHLRVNEKIRLDGSVQKVAVAPLDSLTDLPPTGASPFRVSDTKWLMFRTSVPEDWRGGDDSAFFEAFLQPTISGSSPTLKLDMYHYVDGEEDASMPYGDQTVVMMFDQLKTGRLLVPVSMPPTEDGYFEFVLKVVGSADGEVDVLGSSFLFTTAKGGVQ